jgi:PmbA protein
LTNDSQSARLVGAFIGAISGPAIARGVSFLKDKMGQPVFAAKALMLIDDPLRRLAASVLARFDGEGSPGEAHGAGRKTAC